MKMNKKNQIAILFIALLAVVTISCGKSKYPGFKETKNGLYYKFYIENKDAKKPGVGDILVAELTVRTADSTLFTNSGNPQKLFKLDTSYYKGDLNEGLALMGIGGKRSISSVFGNSIPKANRTPNTAPEAPTVGMFICILINSLVYSPAC